MSYIKKEEYIARFGEEAWTEESKKRVAKTRAWQTNNADAYKRYYTQYNSDHKKQHREHDKNRWISNKEKEAKRNKEYYTTTNGRAHNLIKLYRRTDKQYDRGTCTLTRDWIVDHIFTSSCIYCGDSDWTHLGCDRVDNSLPHTPENCVCSCGICNVDRQLKRMSVSEFKEYRKTHFRECDKQQRAAPN